MGTGAGEFAADERQRLDDVVGELNRRGIEVNLPSSKDYGEKKHPLLVSLSDVEEKEAEWMVAQYMPKGQIIVLAGDGGAGKTTIWCGLASAVSNGSQVFFEERLPEGFGRNEP